MNPYGTIKHKMKGRFRIGDRARVMYIWPDAVVEIVEDHGPIGGGGRYYYHVRVMRPGLEDTCMDWPEDELIPIDNAAEAGKGTPLHPPTAT